MAKGSIGSGYELILHPISSLSQRCASMLRFARVIEKVGALYLITAYGGYRLRSTNSPALNCPAIRPCPKAESNIHKRCELVV
jgi:ribosomal protein S19E (S16A)